MIFGRIPISRWKIVKEYGFKKVLVHFGGPVPRSRLLDAVTGSLEAEEYVCDAGRRTGQSQLHLWARRASNCALRRAWIWCWRLEEAA